MKFYLINGNFTDKFSPGPAFKEILEAHHKYWAPFMQAGKVLVAGPKTKGAGLVIFKADEGEDVNEVINNDPFVVSGIAAFEALEFNAFFAAPCASEWFEK